MITHVFFLIGHLDGMTIGILDVKDGRSPISLIPQRIMWNQAPIVYLELLRLG